MTAAIDTDDVICAEPFTIGPTLTSLHEDPNAARVRFERNHFLRLNNVLQSTFAERILSLSEVATFSRIEGTGIEAEAPQRVGRLLDVTIGRSNLMRWLEQVTGCGPLVGFRGRLTQALQATAGRRVWHDDLDESDKRRLALVINLSPAPFSGGTFELRHKSGESILKHHYALPGEAILFRVAPTLEHRVLPVLSGGPRRVFAGWFVSE